MGKSTYIPFIIKKYTSLLLSKILSQAVTVMNLVLIKYGAGRHALLQTVQQAVVTVRLAYANRIIYSLCLGTTKLGICSFYLRVFQDRTSRILSYILIGFIGLYTLFFMIFTTVFCFPNPNIPIYKGKCTHNTPDLYVSGTCNILADLLLFIFVAPRICEYSLSVISDLELPPS